MRYFVTRPNELFHHGIKGQEWGVRRFQYKDGSVTPAGARRYYVNPSLLGKGSGATVQNAGPNSKVSGGSSSESPKEPEETKEEPKVEETKQEEKKDYDVDAVAAAVIRGDWGNGQERIDKLKEAGYDYDEVQSKVNEMMSGYYSAPISSISSSSGGSGTSGSSSSSASNASTSSRGSSASNNSNYKPRYELNPRTATEAEAVAKRIIYNQQHGQPTTAREAEARYRKLYGR